MEGGKRGSGPRAAAHGMQQHRSGSSDIWLLLFVCCLLMAPSCIVFSCGKRQERDRTARHIQFDALAGQVGSDLEELEGKLGHVGSLTPEDREDLLGDVRDLRANYQKVLQDFQGIRADDWIESETIRVQQQWMLDRMGGHVR